MKILSIFFLALSVISLISCNGDDNEDNMDPNDPQQQQGDFDFFISGKIDGESFAYGVDLDAASSDYLPSTGGALYEDLANNNCSYSYDGGITPNFDDELPSAAITYNRFYMGGCSGIDEISVFNDLFTNGLKNYAVDENEEGIIIGFSEGSNGNVYTTTGGTQAGSSFIISSSTSANETVGTQTMYRQTISGSFSCTIYNDSNPADSKSITEGVFTVQVEAFKD